MYWLFIPVVCEKYAKQPIMKHVLECSKMFNYLLEYLTLVSRDIEEGNLKPKTNIRKRSCRMPATIPIHFLRVSQSWSCCSWWIQDQVPQTKSTTSGCSWITWGRSTRFGARRFGMFENNGAGRPWMLVMTPMLSLHCVAIISLLNMFQWTSRLGNIWGKVPFYRHWPMRSR